MTVPTLSVHCKRNFNEEVESCKQNTTLPNFKEPSIISYNKGRSSKGMRARAKILKVNRRFHASIDVQPVTPCSFSLKIIYVSKRLEWCVFLWVQLISLGYFLLCPAINRESKFAFTIYNKRFGDFIGTIFGKQRKKTWLTLNCLCNMIIKKGNELMKWCILTSFTSLMRIKVLKLGEIRKNY